MKFKLTLLLIAFFSFNSYAQDRIQLENGELLGYITLVNDSILKFKVNKDDKSEFTLKRRAVISYAYAEPVIDSANYKYIYLLKKSDKDTLIKHGIGDVCRYQLKGNCEDNLLKGTIIKITSYRITLLYRGPFGEWQQTEVPLNELCYLAKRSVGETILKMGGSDPLHDPIGTIASEFVDGYKKFKLSDPNIQLLLGK